MSDSDMLFKYRRNLIAEALAFLSKVFLVKAKLSDDRPSDLIVISYTSVQAKDK